MVLKVEESIKKRIAINSKVDFTKLKEEMISRFVNERAVDYAIFNLIRSEILQQIEGKRVLVRKK